MNTSDTRIVAKLLAPTHLRLCPNAATARSSGLVIGDVQLIGGVVVGIVVHRLVEQPVATATALSTVEQAFLWVQERIVRRLDGVDDPDAAWVPLTDRRAAEPLWPITQEATCHDA